MIDNSPHERIGVTGISRFDVVTWAARTVSGMHQGPVAALWAAHHSILN